MKFKNILVFVLSLAIIIILSQPGLTKEAVESITASYTIHVPGNFDPLMIEFTPKGNADYFCVLLTKGNGTAQSLFCMPKGKKSESK